LEDKWIVMIVIQKLKIKDQTDKLMDRGS
jgi:hypothetical protein